MYLTSVIDIALWNKAGWKGTVFGYYPDAECPLFMGPMFTDEEAGTEIFRRWRKHIGEIDTHELIKVSIIEGDIDGEKPGYSVHISTNPQAAIDLAEIRGHKISDSHILMTGRFHRMTPPIDSPNLPNFKNIYSKEGRYLLLPAVQRPNEIEPLFELGIQKKAMSFLQADELGDNDLEVVVLKRPCDTNPPWDKAEETGKPADKQSMTVALAILEAELATGYVKQPVDPMIADCLAYVKYDENGLAVSDTVNPMLYALATTVMGDVIERQALNVPLHQLQAEYVSFLEKYFRQPHEQMLKHGVTPHQIAKDMAGRKSIVESWAKTAPEMLEALSEFWQKAGIVILAHLRQQRSLRAVYGGNVFPHPSSDLISNVSLYADTLVLPDPLLTSLAMHKTVAPPEMVYILVKNALTAMSYRTLATTDLDVPIVVFAPSYFFLSDQMQEIISLMSSEDLRLHLQKVFARKFSDVEEAKMYMDSFADAEAMANAITNRDRFVFDIEESPLPLDQILCLAKDTDKLLIPSEFSDPRLHVLMAFQGRFMQTNSALAHSDLYGGVPLIDAPTSWQYLLWKYEYASEDIAGVMSQRDMIIQHVLHTELRNMPALRKVPPDAIVEIRRRGIISELREVFRKGISEIEHADEKSVEAVAKHVATNLREALEKYETEVKSLTKDKYAFLGNTAIVAGGVGIGIAAAVCGGIPLGIAGAIAGPLGVPSAKDLIKHARNIYAKHKKLKQHPVGLFWKTTK